MQEEDHYRVDREATFEIKDEEMIEFIKEYVEDYTQDVKNQTQYVSDQMPQYIAMLPPNLISESE